jgi:dipeptidyl aminopeptidase/acylaminoacyl peptidase
LPLAVDELLTITAAREAALSPTGDAVAFVISAVEGEREVARVGLVEAGAEVRLLAEGRGPAWSPAGDALVYATAAEVRRFDLRDGSDRPIASFATPPGRPRFSPRGDRIAVPVGRSGLAVVALDGAVETIEADLGVDIVAPSWSPDGETLVFGSARPGGGGVGPTSRIERWRPGGAPAAVETGLAYATCPSFSPDGETLALIGVPTPRLGLPDPGLRPWLVPAAGGTAAPAGDGPEGVVLEPVPVGPVWAPAGGALYLRLARRGAIDLVRIDLAGGASTTLTGGSQVVDFSLAGERLAVAAIAPDDPGSIHLLDVFGGEVARRSVWESPSAGRGVAVPAPRSFAAPDGTELDGWVAGVDPARGPQPTLLAFHGGPHGFFGPGFQRGHFYRDVLASHGWIVLTVNSTGSGSRGAAFADRLRGCWGERDLPEQLAALDQLIAEGVADPTRLAVAGYSYGRRDRGADHRPRELRASLRHR